MNSLMAFAMGEANRGEEQMVFDWDMAARLIREYRPETAAAGLCGDWEYTGDLIYQDGAPTWEGNTYLASTWAVPELQMDDMLIPCYRMASKTPGWDADTKWPASALAILQEVKP